MIAEIQAEEEQFVRDVYIASCLQNAVNNIAHICGGVTISKDYYSIITAKESVAETRSEAEIYTQITNKLKRMGS